VLSLQRSLHVTTKKKAQLKTRVKLISFLML